MHRRSFIQQTSILTAGFAVAPFSFSLARGVNFPVVRVPVGERHFTSPAIENAIKRVTKNIGNKEIAWLFNNCFPNTLDTTVDFETIGGKPDTYVITGDIDAMWLRDSTAQVWPYLPFCKEDKALQQLIAGVINRQTKCILLDPYANAFFKDVTKVSEWKYDLTTMKPGIHERKWEIDSLCYPIRLAHGYWQATGDVTPFDADWKEAMRLVLQTFTEQQRLTGDGPYTFQRRTSWATDGVPLAGYGYPTKKVGLIHSMFRPSDDATIYPFLIPSNFFALESLNQLQQLLKRIDGNVPMSPTFSNLHASLTKALGQYAYTTHPTYGKIIAYEANGLGSYNIMDDANVPSLLSLPYLMGDKFGQSPVYKATRKLLLSEENPFFFKGTAGEGIGGPHVGMDYIWPMSITMRALTSNDDGEIKKCLKLLQNTHAGTGFMHESFHKNDPAKFTRKWFAWANTLFGELVYKLYTQKPYLLNS